MYELHKLWCAVLGLNLYQGKLSVVCSISTNSLFSCRYAKQYRWKRTEASGISYRLM